MTSVELDILVPVYNEGANVLLVYDKMLLSIPSPISWRIRFVYDFDEDTTLPFIRTLSEKDPRVSGVKQTFGKGVVNALKFGFSSVHDGAVLVVMGDNSDDLALIPTMLSHFKDGASVVSPSRFSKGGRYIGGSFLKKNLSCLAGRILYVCGIGTKDPTNNFKLYSGKLLKELEIESEGGFEIALEITAKSALRGDNIKELACTWTDRTLGQSKFQFRKWLPHYLRWFTYYLNRRFLRNQYVEQR